MEKYSLTKTFHRSMYPAIDPTNPANTAAGKTVAISGGGAGIGYAIARGFCKAGASTVILLGRRQGVLDEASASLHASHPGTTIWTYSLDVRDTSATNATFASIRQRLRSGTNDETADVDILVANAAVLDQGEVSLDFDPGVVANAFATNVFGVANLARAFLAPELPAVPNAAWTSSADPIGAKKDVSSVRAPGRAKVLLELSSASSHIQFPGQAVYGTTKLAATNFLRYLQAELDRMPGSPVRVHSFHPGAVFTPGVKDLGVKEDVLAWDDVSLPEGFAVWLASPAAEFLKGRLPWANWDVAELLEMKNKFEEDPEYCTVTMKM